MIVMEKSLIFLRETGERLAKSPGPYPFPQAFGVDSMATEGSKSSQNLIINYGFPWDF